MSLFPAYAAPCESDALTQASPAPAWPARQQAQASPLPPLAAGDEAALLASDSDSDSNSPPLPPQSQSPPARLAAAPPDAPYYEERRGERGNLRVSTLYCPGRPE